MKKRTTLIGLFIISILLCSCEVPSTDKENDSKRLMAPKELKNPVESPKPKKVHKPLVESPLNDLNKEEFIKQYNELPESYVFEVSEEICSSGRMTKKEMLNEVFYLCLDDLTFDDDNDIISLKGLRFFQGLKRLELYDVYVVDIQELSFINMDELEAIGCIFEEIADGVFPIPNHKDSKVILNNCNLENLDFLQNYEELNAILDFSNNEITDISALKKFKNQKIDILLNGNKINDISVFHEFTVPVKQIGLSGNRIMDIRPLKNVLDKDTILEIGDNCILDYSIIKDFMENHYYVNNSHYRHKEDHFRIERVEGYKLRINQKEVEEFSETPFIYFNTELSEEFIDDLSSIWDKARPACSALMFIEQLGGSAEYNIEKGILTCTLNGKNYTFKDFEFEVDCNGKRKTIINPMKRMQGNIPYMAIKDMCKVFDLKYSEGNKKNFWYDFIGEDNHPIEYKRRFANEVDVTTDSVLPSEEPD